MLVSGLYKSKLFLATLIKREQEMLCLYFKGCHNFFVFSQFSEKLVPYLYKSKKNSGNTDRRGAIQAAFSQQWRLQAGICHEVTAWFLRSDIWSRPACFAARESTGCCNLPDNMHKWGSVVIEAQSSKSFDCWPRLFLCHICCKFWTSGSWWKQCHSVMEVKVMKCKELVRRQRKLTRNLLSQMPKRVQLAHRLCIWSLGATPRRHLPPHRPHNQWPIWILTLLCWKYTTENHHQNEIILTSRIPTIGSVTPCCSPNVLCSCLTSISFCSLKVSKNLRWRIAFVRKFLLNEKEIAKNYLTKVVAHKCSPIFY